MGCCCTKCKIEWGFEELWKSCTQQFLASSETSKAHCVPAPCTPRAGLSSLAFWCFIFNTDLKIKPAFVLIETKTGGECPRISQCTSFKWLWFLFLATYNYLMNRFCWVSFRFFFFLFSLHEEKLIFIFWPACSSAVPSFCH